MRLGTRKTAVKIFASVVLVGGAASVAGLGTFGSFTSTTSASAATGTGKVVLATGASVRGLDVSATNLVPGDTVERTVTLTRSSDTESFGSVKLTTAATTNNVLTTDATNGLQMKVDQCSVAWVQPAGGNVLTCSGTTTPVIAQRAVIGSTLDLGAATTTLNTAAAASNLRVTLSLPTSADNTFQGLSNTVSFTFDATQRAAQSL
ncbi:TasA family protein [Nocardioides sp. URHA0032]|jgi:spore coat-associated protein N|uniref:TasA family protein n=1 Tax=Nocardioides sp. URHA0032 TaxID=1380388 RepID=UPI00048B0E43|nr:TasA family protein [Nocardioides sp. URHA0032]